MTMKQPTERQSLVSRVKALAEALEESEVSELDILEDGTRVLLKRQLDPPAAPVRVARRGASARPAHRHPEGSGPTSAPEPGIAVVAPLTGVFYTSSSPSSPSFVEIGDAIQAGQVVCIVEAMKVFNEIKSEVAGTISAFVAQNGQLVQKGDALIRVKPQ